MTTKKPSSDPSDDVAALVAAVTDLRRQIKDERDAKHTTNRLIVAALVIVLALSTWGWRSNAGRINDINQARTDARVVACNAQNATTDSINGILLTFTAPRPGQSAESQAQVKAAIDRLLLPRRDCSARGVDEYYKAKAK